MIEHMFDTIPVLDEAPVIPRWLDTKTPDMMVSAILDNIDIRQLNGHDRIKVLKARQRQVSQLAARLYDDMVAVVEYLDTEWDNDNITAPEAAAAEIRAALHLTRRAADAELALAIDLKHRLPQVWAALERGDLDPRRARTITHGTEHLTDTTAHAVVDLIIDDAPSLTTGQIAAKVRKLSIETAPEEAADNYQRAVERRMITTQPNPDGTGNIHGYNLPAERVTSYQATLSARQPQPRSAASPDPGASSLRASCTRRQFSHRRNAVTRLGRRPRRRQADSWR